MEKPIYPNIDIRKGAETRTGPIKAQMNITTFIRKEHDGIWYLWEVFKSYWCDEDKFNSEAEQRWINDFHKEVYLVIVCGKVDLQLIAPDGLPIFSKDKNQEQETERLKKILTT